MLGKLRINDGPAGLELPEGAGKREKASMKIQKKLRQETDFTRIF